MKTIRESDKLSLTHCKTVLNKKGYHYTDDEVLAIRDWLYFFAEIVIRTTQENKPNH